MMTMMADCSSFSGLAEEPKRLLASSLVYLDHVMGLL
jgi:hypothetical protein